MKRTKDISKTDSGGKIKIAVERSASLSSRYEDRYVVVNVETGEIVDNAQGYGYKTKQKAHAAWAYKTRDKSKDKEKQAERRKIRYWLKQHKEVQDDVESLWLDAMKNYEDVKLNAKTMRQILKNNDLEVDFSIRDLIYILTH